jgi:hypothetical protein
MTVTFTVKTEDAANYTFKYASGCENGYTVAWSIKNNATDQALAAAEGEYQITINSGNSVTQSVPVDVDAIIAELPAKFTNAKLKTVTATQANVIGFSEVLAGRNSFNVTTSSANITKGKYFPIQVTFTCDNFDSVTKTVYVYSVEKTALTTDDFVVPTTAPTATYTGEGQDIAAGSVTMSRQDLKGTVTYAYTPVGGGATLDVGTKLPLTPGTYSVVASYNDDDCYGSSSSFTVTMNKADVKVVAVHLDDRAFNGENDVSATVASVEFDVPMKSNLTISSDYFTNGVVQYADGNVGENKVATGLTAVTLSDTLAKLYNLTNGANTTALDAMTTGNITPKTVTVSAVWDKNKVVNAGEGNESVPVVTVMTTKLTTNVELVEGTDYVVTSDYNSAKEGYGYATVSPATSGSNYTFTPVEKIYFEVAAYVDSRTQLTSENAVVVSKVTMTEGAGTYDASSVSIKVGDDAVTGTFNWTEVEDQILAMKNADNSTDTNKVSVKFTANDSKYVGEVTVTVEVVVNAKTTANEEPEDEVIGETVGDADGQYVNYAVAVVTADTVVLGNKKEAKPTIKVYYKGAALNSKAYDVEYYNNDKEGEATATVTLTDKAPAGCTFEGESETQDVSFTVVKEKSDLDTLTISKVITVNYGSYDNSDLTNILKNAAKLTVGNKKQSKGVTYKWNLSETADVGTYFVTVTAVYENKEYYAQASVYVKPAKITLKTITLDKEITTEYAATLDKGAVADLIKDYLVKNGVGGYALSKDDFTVEVTRDLAKNFTKAGKKSISYKIKLADGSNYIFGTKDTKTSTAKITVTAAK